MSDRFLLPVLAEQVTTCDGCGACCMEQGSPPMYLLYLLSPEICDPADEDAVRVRQLPDELQQELRQYGERLRTRPPSDKDGPCIWFDQVTRRCKHYELRPSICREFELNSSACHAWRRQYGAQ